MAVNSSRLEMDRCPHCSVAKPTLSQIHLYVGRNHLGQISGEWGFYMCSNCGDMVMAKAKQQGGPVVKTFPAPRTADQALPVPVRNYLQQAIESIHAPSGAVMLSASSVDSMLKIKGYKNGSLSERIDKAAEDHLITADMALWAHQVRLDANDQRHSDESVPLPSKEDAERVIEFVEALGTYLFVLPALVNKGLGKILPFCMIVFPLPFFLQDIYRLF